jgi:hippurate hydrolase
LSICRFQSGEIDNIIPETAEFSGTLRSLDNETARILEDSVHEICHAAAVIHRVRCDVFTDQCYLATCNAPEPTERLCKVVKELGIPLHILEDSAMSSEDFSFFLAKAPGVFFRLGAGEDMVSLHNPRFFPPEEVMENGIKVMTAFALESLKEQ